jgi:hypothetical protein
VEWQAVLVWFSKGLALLSDLTLSNFPWVKNSYFNSSSIYGVFLPAWIIFVPLTK